MHIRILNVMFKQLNEFGTWSDVIKLLLQPKWQSLLLWLCPGQMFLTISQQINAQKKNNEKRRRVSVPFTVSNKPQIVELFRISDI